MSKSKKKKSNKKNTPKKNNTSKPNINTNKKVDKEQENSQKKVFEENKYFKKDETIKKDDKSISKNESKENEKLNKNSKQANNKEHENEKLEENKILKNIEESDNKEENLNSKDDSKIDAKEDQTESKKEKEKKERKAKKEEIQNSNYSKKINNEKKTINSIKESKKETESKALIKSDTEDNTGNESLKNRRKIIIFICIVIFVIMILGFSTIFSLLNINNTKIAKGIKINNIDISNLTIDEAKEKLNSNFEKELIPELSLKYKDEYSTVIIPKQLEIKYNIEEMLNKAYNIGRNGNIITNNYALLFTTLFGKEINLDYTYNEEFLNNFLEDINSKLPGVVIQPSYYIEEEKLIIESGKDGIEIVRNELKEDILDSLISRTLEQVSKENYSQTIDIPTKKAKASKIDMDKIYSEIHTEPKDACFQLDPYNIYPETDGIDLQMTLEEAKKQITEDKEEYKFDLKITKAEKTISDLGMEAFPYVISSFSTKYDASNINRSINLKIAAQKINGKVLMPGEVFSYNKVLGKRTVEEGYRDAKIFADGGTVDGLAGGICQISSTLYNAVLLANLEIVERRNHSFTTSYVAAGRDATVVWGKIDFQFKNSRNYPIKIEASVNGGVAEFKIHGVQEEEYEISILPKTTASIPYTTTYIEDPTLAPGQQAISQAGHLGYKVTTTVVKKLNGVEVSREVISNDTYQPMKAIIRRSPGVPPEVPVQ